MGCISVYRFNLRIVRICQGGQQIETKKVKAKTACYTLYCTSATVSYLHCNDIHRFIIYAANIQYTHGPSRKGNEPTVQYTVYQVALLYLYCTCSAIAL